jgi:predicted Fe-Mo cluster-binding NifX family protein
MKVAVPVWNELVSPVFDVARHLRVFSFVGRKPADIATVTVQKGTAANAVIELGSDVLICSAISACTVSMLRLAGVKVISDICGSPERIVEAYAAGDSTLAAFRAPGPRESGGGRPASTAGRGRHRKEASR